MGCMNSQEKSKLEVVMTKLNKKDTKVEESERYTTITITNKNFMAGLLLQLIRLKFLRLQNINTKK